MNALEVEGRKYWTGLEAALVSLQIDYTKKRADQVGFLDDNEELLKFYYNATEGKLVLVRDGDVRKKAFDVRERLIGRMDV